MLRKDTQNNQKITPEIKEEKNQPIKFFDITQDEILIGFKNFHTKSIDTVMDELIQDPTKNYYLVYRFLELSDSEKQAIKTKVVNLKTKENKTSGECVFLYGIHTLIHLELDEIPQNELNKYLDQAAEKKEPTALAFKADNQLVSHPFSSQKNDFDILNGWQLHQEAASLGSALAYLNLERIKDLRTDLIEIQTQINQMLRDNPNLFFYKSGELGDQYALLKLACDYEDQKESELTKKYYQKASKLGCERSLLQLACIAIKEEEIVKAGAYLRTLMEIPRVATKYTQTELIKHTYSISENHPSFPEFVYHYCVGSLHHFLVRGEKDQTEFFYNDLKNKMLEIQTRFTSFLLNHPLLYSQLIMIDGWDRVEPLILPDKRKELKVQFDKIKEIQDTVMYSSAPQMPTDHVNLIWSYTGFFTPPKESKKEEKSLLDKTQDLLDKISKAPS